MIPHQPPRVPATGFLYFPPYRVQGYSIAGEETYVQVPELDVCFDIGRSPRAALTSNYVALSHGHMDHAAGIAYYFSQRHFQGMSPGTVLCHTTLEQPIRKLMAAWVDIEAQRTPHNIIPMKHDEEFEIKNTIFLRAFETVHTSPSLGFAVVEKRSKLKEELLGLPQSKLVEMKEAGQQITYMKEVPLVAYMGDTAPGDHFTRPDVTDAKLLIVECTFTEPGHEDRAKVGKHLHLTDIVDLLPSLKSEAIVLTHLSRRTHLGQARDALAAALPEEDRDRVFILMDSKANRQRYENQAEEAGASDAQG